MNFTTHTPNSVDWDEKTSLSALKLPHMDIILTERFLLPPAALLKQGEALPETLGDIKNLTGMDLPAIVQIIQECHELSQGVYWAGESLDRVAEQENCLIIDMRPDVQIDDEPLHPAARLFHLESPQRMIPFLRTLELVIVLSGKQGHAWSAALGLRKMGIMAYIVSERDNVN